MNDCHLDLSPVNNSDSEFVREWGRLISDGGRGLEFHPSSECCQNVCWSSLFRRNSRRVPKICIFFLIFLLARFADARSDLLVNYYIFLSVC